jgi:hypothetical protein
MRPTTGFHREERVTQFDKGAFRQPVPDFYEPVVIELLPQHRIKVSRQSPAAQLRQAVRQANTPAVQAKAIEPPGTEDRIIDETFRPGEEGDEPDRKKQPTRVRHQPSDREGCGSQPAGVFARGSIPRLTARLAVTNMTRDGANIRLQKNLQST